MGRNKLEEFITRKVILLVSIKQREYHINPTCLPVCPYAKQVAFVRWKIRGTIG
jgi:hypothetical protein